VALLRRLLWNTSSLLVVVLGQAAEKTDIFVFTIFVAVVAAVADTGRLPGFL
jgi:hypothetical protein